MTSPYHSDGSLVLDQPVDLPDVLDVLIVGGGPAGTAAAFRAKELGLSALVIDFDDLLKRIRDYSKDKLILPDFGGGDRMCFPAADELIANLQFGPIDKDDMCAAWRDLYRRFNVPARIGVELRGLELQDDGWRVNAFNHRTREPETLLARHVVLAIGRGVPRRFDIPGNTEGIAYRMDDPAGFVSGPACIIGGGTSAAEAVIAISNAKVAAESESPVYWSYRGTKMPRVSKGLSDEFFEAYVGNGNIRYHPHSEPVAVVIGDDRREYLSIRIDRKSADGRPPETVHLEFPKTQCVACIGEDIPETFLSELGIDMVTGDAGRKAKKMMLVDPLLETRQPNVYLIGDLLSQAYLETTDFDASADTFRKIKHRGNIKTSLRDGVFVMEVIQQRLEGREQVQVTIRDAEPTPVENVVTLEAPGSRTEAPSESDASVPGEVAEQVAYLSRTTPTGIEAEQYPLHEGRPTTIGRIGCDVNCPQDTLLSDHHASIFQRDGAFFLRDDGSRSGTYLRIRHGYPVSVAPGGIVRLGRQILVVAEDGGHLAMIHYDPSGKAQGRHELTMETTVFGRQGGAKDPDIALDDADRTLSRFHMSATPRGKVVELNDFNSRNGTYLKVDGDRRLEPHDIFRVGAQYFEVMLGRELPHKTSSSPAAPAPSVEADSEPPPPAPPPVPIPGTQPRVTLQGQDISDEIKPSQTILDWVDERGVDIDFECEAGLCGCDPIRILEGQEYLNELGEKETKALTRFGLEPGPCRLACMAKVSGPVVVELLE